MSSGSRRTAFAGLLRMSLVAVFAASALYSGPACARRPEVDRLRNIVAQHPRDLPRAIKALAALDVGGRVRRICHVDARDTVFCVNSSRLIAEQMPHRADANLIHMSLNDMLDLLGGAATQAKDTLVACGSAQFDGVTDLVTVNGGPSAPIEERGIGVAAPSPGARPPGARPGTRPGAPGLANDLGAGLKQSAIKACRDAQFERIRTNIDALTPRDRGYEAAVQTAVDAMDAAAGSCKQSSVNPIAANAADSGASATGAGASASGTEAVQERKKPTAGEQIVGVLNLSLGFADTVVAGFQLATSTTPSLLGLGAVVVGTVGLVAGGGELLAGSETAGKVGDVTQVAGFVITAIESGSGAVAVIGAEAAFLPVVGAAFTGVAIGKAIEENFGPSVREVQLGLWGAVSDANWSTTYGHRPGPVGGGAGQPVPDGAGGRSCDAVAGRWALFKASCSQPGNRWQTYDCAAFVARMNGCADPALINPGPQGDATCRARCSGGHNIATRGSNGVRIGSAGRFRLNATPHGCIDALVHECEQKKLIAGVGVRQYVDGMPSCRNHFEERDRLQAVLSRTIRAKICLSAQGELCGAAPLGRQDRLGR